jgi:hypothetical protein
MPVRLLRMQRQHLPWMGKLHYQVEANAFSLPCDVHRDRFAAWIPCRTGGSRNWRAHRAIFTAIWLHAALSPKSWFLKSERDDHILSVWKPGDRPHCWRPQPPALSICSLTMDWELDLASGHHPLDIALTAVAAAPCTTRTP